MKQRQGGFTLIELVMVIVILGVLAAIAIPKFIDLKGDADTAVTNYGLGADAEHAASNLACLQTPAGKASGGVAHCNP